MLNHIDQVPAERRASMVADLKRLLVADGLEGVPVICTSAKLGEGIPDLLKAITTRVAAKQATRARLLADVVTVATGMRELNGTADPGHVARTRTSELVDAFADAAGVPTVVHAVEKATRVRATRNTGWPITAWLARLRPDPLKRLHLDLGAQGRELTRTARASVPEATQVQRARVDAAVRGVADDVSEELTRPWADAVRRASVSRLADLGDGLDKAVAGTDLGVSRTPLWWRLVRVTQWLLVLAALTGGLWLAGLAVLGYLRVPAPEPPAFAGLPVPTLMLLAGVAVGVLLALGCRVLARLSARAKARSADRRLRAAIAEVTEDLVIAPIDAEVDDYRRARDGLATALR